MKQVFFILSFLLILSCTSTKQTFWCGDHACANKQEKDEYFNKTMIVEIKDIEKKSSKNNSEIEKVILQAQDNDKKKIKKGKYLDKQEKLETKRMEKEKKRLAKQAKLEAKRIEKERKKIGI